ncbi:MAG TPA: MFS transporter, partial [Nocardioides sp.]|uniref:MFS transporter n=1 Tax=Nocardioides sp. TaxID=35761 RepID=UPI002BA508A3
ALASLLCAVASQVPLFMAGRAAQGIANAFTTPILLAALSDLTPAAHLGRVLGRFGSMQAAGLTFAPVIGGLAAAVDWRWAFWITMVTALALATRPPHDAPRAAAAPVAWRSLLNPRLGFACVIAALAYLTTIGITTLSALLAGDRFGLPPGGRGAVVAVFGVTGLLAGGSAGRLLDRLGARRFGLIAYVALASAAVLAGLSPALVVLVVALALGGIAGLASRVTVNSLAVLSTPGNRSGAASVMLACQFLGGALAPAILIPVYRHDHTLGLVAAAVSCLLAAVVLLLAPGRWVGERSP